MSQTSSLTQNVAPIAAGTHVVAAAFLGRTPVFALADGQVLLAEIGDEKRVVAHAEGAILVAASDGQRLVTGGDDGRVVSVSVSGDIQDIADEKGRWIDALALRDSGECAWSAGKIVRARDAKGTIAEWQAPSSVRGLTFMPKGYRLAASHYNGVSLWFPATKAAPEALTWKGSHLDVTTSPDGRFVVTSMQENALHGWRVADRQDMRMTGYPSKPRSFSWSHDGNWLATSGAEASIIWPFQAKSGPMGQQPRECGVRPAKVSKIAFHPKALVLAIGYEDGWLMLCRLTDASEILVRAPEVGTDAGEITALCWDKDGKRLAFGAADGFAGLLTLP
ncbi:WD40 repeat domain-containing protein [Methylovirgula sp. 4M-Z18]|uniref:WD40 repeat domain-containing protein n=1 Tax=Methylovirgula sp. 4M-Z18 TaxID=2293567 RepID=UPI000E2FD561|nr:WD40 repeat domain-containing protein [Methylovirgula sp. 4M-Z18]RFB78100.1 WD40 repeat domain-containing protein [Methylovirgula sp. 4M-Z18]